MKVTINHWFRNTAQPFERVLHGSQVQPNQALGLREIIDRFTRGVPAVGKVNLNFDQDAEALMNAAYVFPDDPDFADYVFAERHMNDLRQQYLNQQASPEASAPPTSSPSTDE